MKIMVDSDGRGPEEASWAFNPKNGKLYIYVIELASGEERQTILTVEGIRDLCAMVEMEDVVRGGPQINFTL